MNSGIRNLHLPDYWGILVHRRWVFLLTVATFTVVSLIATYTTVPQYRASTTLHIERQSPDIFTFQDLGQSEMSWTAYTDFYETQYKILSSPAVARRAAERLDWTSRPVFYESSNPGIVARLKSLVPRTAPRVERDPLDVAAGQILGGLEVSPERNSQLVRVSWISDDPEQAREVANALAAAYIAYNIEAQFATTDQAQEFLVDQISKLRREVSSIEDDLQKYGEQNRILSLDDSNNITLTAVKDTAERRTVAQTRLVEAEATWRAVEQTDASALTEVLRSDLIARLRQEYASYEAEYTEKARRFKDDWPGMEVLQSKLQRAAERLDLEIERLAGQVRGAAKTDYETALREVRALDRLLVEQEQAAQRLKRGGVEFANLSGEVSSKRDTLDALQQRQIEMALSSQLKDMDSTSTNIRVVDEARLPQAPFTPNPKRNLILALLLGTISGIGFAFLLDYLDNTITSVGQVASTISFPLLAVIPRHRDVASTRKQRGPLAPAVEFDLITATDGRAVVSEAYRDLRTSILLSHPGEPPRRLMVTSALPEEGKTATVVNLAIVLAQLGRRVALVDTDLRRPRLHKVLRKNNERGVSTFLSGLEQDVHTLIIGTGIENLDLIPSGPIPPNPSELLDSQRFAQLAEELLASGYDHVLFDSPPALSVSDPVIIASQVDVGILVVRAAKTPRQSVRLAGDKFRHADSRNLGVVLNDLDAERRGAAHYRYQYYGRYGEEETSDGSARVGESGG